MQATPTDAGPVPPATPADGFRIYGRLLGYAKPHWPMFALGVLGMMIFAACDTGFAWLVKQFLDGAFVAQDPDTLLIVPVGIVVLFLFRGIGDYLGAWAPGWVGRQVVKQLRADLFRHYLDLPVAYYDRSSSGQLLSRLTYNTELVATAATTAVTVLIRDTLTIVGLLAWLFYSNWQLTALALTIAPVIGWLIQRINRGFRRYSTRIQDSMGDVTRVAKEAIEGQRLVKVFNAQGHEVRLFETVIEHNRLQNMKLVRAQATSNPVVQMVSAVALAGVMWVAIRDVLDHGMTVGEFTSFLTALLLIAARLAAAREAGLKVGVIHVFDPCRPADAQSAFFTRMVPRDSGWLPPAIALTRLADGCAQPVSDAAVESELVTFINQIETHAGKPVILKLGRAFQERHRSAQALERDLWLMRDRAQPDYAGRPWLLWSANASLVSEAAEEPIEWAVVQK